MRPAAWPSQSSGRRGAGGDSSPTSWLVPSVMVMGRSVLSRSVRQGTPSTVVSSWMPPESVSTSRAPPAGRGSRGSRAARRPGCLGESCRRAAHACGMHREDERQLLGDLLESGDDGPEDPRIVHGGRTVQRDEAVARLLRVGAGPDAEGDVRHADPELLQEHLAHAGVVVLDRVDEAGLRAPRLEGVDDRVDLHEFGRAAAAADETHWGGRLRGPSCHERRQTRRYLGLGRAPGGDAR